MLRSATANTLPPRPPSPPSGPPRGMYFSRRNDAAPFPPSPAMTSISASSMNFTPCTSSRLVLQIKHVAFGRVTAAATLPVDAPARQRGCCAADRAVLNEQRAAVGHLGGLLADRRNPREIEQQRALRIAEVATGNAPLC